MVAWMDVDFSTVIALICNVVDGIDHQLTNLYFLTAFAYARM